MYEATISTQLRDKYILDYIKNQTESSAAEMDAVTTDLVCNNRIYYAVACSDTFRFQMKRILSNNVSSAVAMGYKNLFVRHCLKIGEGNFFQNILINTMCVFDREYDRQIVAKVLDMEKPIYLDGYFNFRLKTLKNKWREIADLVSENGYILHDSRLILEFVQYLLESVTTKASELTVSFEKDDFLLFDSDNNVLPKTCSLANNPTIEEDAAVNIILFKPKNLKVYANRAPSEEFCRFSQLFNCALKIV